MKKNIKKVLLYLGIFVLLFAVGIAISDLIIIARAHHILYISDTLGFEKDLNKIFPPVKKEENGMELIKKVYDMRQNLPKELKQLDQHICSKHLRDESIPPETLKHFWLSKEVENITKELSSVPFTMQYSFNTAEYGNDFKRQKEMILSMHRFYLHYLKFNTIEGNKLQSLHVFQKLLLLQRAIERQPMPTTDETLQQLWVQSLDALVHYGPSEKRYEDYYKALQQLINSLDFKCHNEAELAIQYNKLQKSTAWTTAEGTNLLSKHQSFINNLKENSNKLYELLRIYPMQPDIKRTPPLNKDVFLKNKTITQTQLKILLHLKLYQIKHGHFPEAVEGFMPLDFADNLIYKRISPDDFILQRK